MARPTTEDLQAGIELMEVLDTIRGLQLGPGPTRGPESLDAAIERSGGVFDPDSSEHLRALYNHLAMLLRSAPGFHLRVIGGMCSLNRRDILSPCSPLLELHPDIKLGQRLLEEHRSQFLDRLESDARQAVRAWVERVAKRHLDELVGDANRRLQRRVTREQS